VSIVERYFVSEGGLPEQQVTKAGFVQAERRAGFRNTMGQPDEPATGGFSGATFMGRIEYVPGQAAIFTWDAEEQPPLATIAGEVARLSGPGCRVFMREYDTQSDQYAWIVSDYEVDDAEAERIDEAGTVTPGELTSGE
jgi:hypothetical protein